MAELGFTRLGLAEEVNRVLKARSRAGAQGLSYATATERWVYRLLAGQTLWPRANYRGALEEIFGCSALELGFLPPFGYRGPRSRLKIADAEGDMDRRRFLLITGTLGAVTVAIPDLGDSTRIGLSDLERLRQPLKELRVLDQRQGGARLAPAAAEVVAELGRILDNATMSAKVRRAAYALQGEYLASAGWFAIDAADGEAAGRYLDRALTVAAMARDPLLQAQIWNVLAWRASEAGKWGEVLTIAQAGMAGAGARREPRIAAAMHGWAAEGYAVQGHQGSATRSIGRAHDALEKVTSSDPPALWLNFVDHSEIDAFGSNAARSLGRYQVANELAERAMLSTPEGRERNRVSRGLMLTQARLGLREVEAAVEAAEEPLSRMTAVHSGRVIRRAREIRDEIAQWPEVPAARDWVARFDAVASA
ncbi:hypothetical protein [Cryptosporangium sp. NPDC048952]|uniref:hypothetical protein n=1 Tax=Cryptosporangium sp. NPDC048952 TaxID=3363961 RepID=UPI003711112E